MTAALPPMITTTPIATPTTATQTMQRARRARRGVKIRITVPIIIIGLYVIGAITVPVIYGFDPLRTELVDRLKPPGTTLSNGSIAFLGTDQIGQDLFAQMMMGARVSLAVGASTLIFAGLAGVTVGLLAGHFGGWMDTVLMRIADVQLAFPAILLAILLASVLGQGLTNIIIVLSIANWVVFARVTRSQVLALKNREFVEAGRALGAGHFHLIVRTLLPGCVAPILVVATVEFGHVILAEAALSFLGVGVPIGVPSLGSTIQAGTAYLTSAWWISTLPGIALAGLVLATGVLGDALRDFYDPTLRGA
ncbi:ABC transporter permease [Tessaracoccus oleiagri]|uniref:Peptide/nickel transport system permease protein n=1 Tax=Tessaracoccus oleiagri TaxID=686624 RepID=A0A1G9LUD8_9ACTN|nr:ABC transporter permease [Tessaracoccus oleiagri]SDL65630.1 peptide/nickel transport system permease protein [Tessaracoccus oleiagri]